MMKPYILDLITMKIIAITADTDKMKITMATIIPTVNTEPDDPGSTANTIRKKINGRDGCRIVSYSFFPRKGDLDTSVLA